LARHPLELALNVEQSLDQAPPDAARREPLLVALLGPTASGKTALSLALAERFDGEIVNCDSVAMYREFEIGTAKPTVAERRRVPHHLFDVVDATGYITAGEYARRARQVVREISERQRLPIVVGGTGLYLRAFLDGLFPGPGRSEDLRDRLRERAAGRGSSYLHKILLRLDRTAAEKIHANDTPKMIRAIEVCLTSGGTMGSEQKSPTLRHAQGRLSRKEREKWGTRGQKMSELWRQQGRDPLRGFRILRIGLDPDRQALYERINRRAGSMFEAGLVEETRVLRQKYGAEARPLDSLGYKQAGLLLRDEVNREQAIVAAQQAHRNYAKRQMTWFRREPEVTWLRGFGDDAGIQAQAVGAVDVSG
jgi:tRNA dimethylallyltransferase